MPGSSKLGRLQTKFTARCGGLDPLREITGSRKSETSLTPWNNHFMPIRGIIPRAIATGRDTFAHLHKQYPLHCKRITGYRLLIRLASQRLERRVFHANSFDSFCYREKRVLFATLADKSSTCGELAVKKLLTRRAERTLGRTKLVCWVGKKSRKKVKRKRIGRRGVWTRERAEEGRKGEKEVTVIGG